MVSLKIHIYLILLLCPVLIAQSGTLRGKVTENKEALPAVTVYIEELKTGTSTDKNGNFIIREIPVGEYTVRVSAIGYVPQWENVSIDENTTTTADFSLTAQTYELQEVEISAKRRREQKDTRTSVLDINPESAKILAGGVEDVLRTLQTLPGVLTPNDFSSQLVVRGSGPDQNLMILDDIEIFNPYRLYGVISMFNPNTLSDVTLLSGGFPAKYGDRLSAALDVTNREGSKESAFKGSINASIVDANLVLEGRNPFSIPGSWLFSSRRTYYDIIMEPVVKKAGLVKDNVSFPSFYDFQTKLVFTPSLKHKLSFTGILSADGVNVVAGEKRRTPDSVSVSNLTKNNAAGISWTYSLGNRLQNKLSYNYYTNNGDADFNSQVLDPSLNRKRFEEFATDTLSPYLLGFRFYSAFDFAKHSVDDKFFYQFGKHTLEFGAGADQLTTTINFRFDIDPQLKSILIANPNIRSAISSIKDVQKYYRGRTFVQGNFTLSERLFIQPGIRFDYYELLGKVYAAPRFSLSYALTSITTLRLAYGSYFQSPGYEKLRDQNILFDLSPKYARGLNAEHSDHYILGLEHWLDDEWNLRGEAYYKSFDNLIIQKRVKGTRFYTEAIPGLDQSRSSGWTRPVPVAGDSVTNIPANDSYGEAYGLEFLLAKKNIRKDSKFSGWISYAFAFANRFERGEKFPFRFDQRHTVNVVLNYDINDSWDLSFRWQYGSGFLNSAPSGIQPRVVLEDQDRDGKPETPVIATRGTFADPGNKQVIFDISFQGTEKFNSRKPDYHRLDIRATHHFTFYGLPCTAYLDIINIYNRSNVLNYQYFINDDRTIGAEANNMFPIIPTFGFSAAF